MNGLKFIRTRCNYSQAALAEELGVSRQAINMWECAKKPLSEIRRAELKEFFGLETDEWFGEIDNDTIEKIKKFPMYRKTGEISDHYHFSPQYDTPFGKYPGHILDNNSDILTLDEKCALKRNELKNLSADIQQYSESLGSKNSHARFALMNRIQRVFGGLYDAMNCIKTKRPGERMIYIRALFAMIDAINIAFGNISLEDFKNTEDKELEAFKKAIGETDDRILVYDFSALTEQVSEMILNRITEYSEIIYGNAVKNKDKVKEQCTAEKA